MTAQEIMKELNTICLLEFMDNYNKSELVRIVKTSEAAHKRAKALKEALQKEVKEGLVVDVSDEGSLFIKEFESDNGTSKTYKQLKNIFPQISKRIPYSYVMGRPVGKRVMQQIVEELKPYTNLV